MVLWLHTRHNRDIADTSGSKTVSTLNWPLFREWVRHLIVPQSAHWGHQGHSHAPERAPDKTTITKWSHWKPGGHFWCFNSTSGITQISLASTLLSIQSAHWVGSRWVLVQQKEQETAKEDDATFHKANRWLTCLSTTTLPLLWSGNIEETNRREVSYPLIFVEMSQAGFLSVCF